MLFLHLKHVVNYCKGKFSLNSEHVSAATAFVLLAALVIMPDAAVAQANTLNDTICSVVNELQGPVARGIAALGIIVLGFSLFLGKITWGLAIALAVGVGAIFGANEIVGIIGDGTNACENANINQG